MKKVFKLAATFFSAIALMGVGTASVFYIYQPDPPKEQK